MDPIADLLTRIRNASMKGKERVDVPLSNIKSEITRVLKEEGYISNFKPVQNEAKRNVIRIFLKYTADKESVIHGIQRVSRPGCRVYRAYENMPKVRGPFGISIVSTSLGVMSDSDALKKKIGGEVLCQVW